MSAQEAAERFARGPGRKIPAAPFPHERRPAEEDDGQSYEPLPSPRPRYRREDHSMYIPVEQPRKNGCVESLFYVALIVVMLAFALWALLQTGILTNGEVTINMPPTAAVMPRATPRPLPTPPNPVGGAASSSGTDAPEPTDAPRQEEQLAQQPAIAPETHTTDPFWTDDELKAFTATAVAFMDPGTLPTPEPAFVEYVATQCADADLVAKSPTLQLWCK